MQSSQQGRCRQDFKYGKICVQIYEQKNVHVQIYEQICMWGRMNEMKNIQRSFLPCGFRILLLFLWRPRKYLVTTQPIGGGGFFFSPLFPSPAQENLSWKSIPSAVVSVYSEVCLSQKEVSTGKVVCLWELWVKIFGYHRDRELSWALKSIYKSTKLDFYLLLILSFTRNLSSHFLAISKPRTAETHVGPISILFYFNFPVTCSRLWAPPLLRFALDLKDICIYLWSTEMF